MKRFIPSYCISLLLLICFTNSSFTVDEHKTLAIGSAAPNFNLKGVDGKTYTLASFKSAKVLAIVFTCNHCPTAQAYEDRIISLAKDYKSKGVQVVAISPNDPTAIRLDELGYTDLGDSFADMKVRAKNKSYNFPYLFDGATEVASKQYGPIATPHIFIFDQNRKLQYSGRIDDVENPAKTPTSKDAVNAIEAILANKAVPVATTKVFGCSVKWAEKSDWIQKAKTEWAAETVTIELIDAKGIKDLLKNDSDKLRLINVWATWCGPCVTEFPEFVTMNRMYRRRDFEFVSISADSPNKKDKALKFLQKSQASNKNFIFSQDDKYKLIESIDPNWQGALPYTIVVEPGGKIVYAKQGSIDPINMKKLIVENKIIGRVY